MLAPSYKKVSIPVDVQKILCEWYATLYKRNKKDVKACMEMIMNQHARLQIGNEIFGSKVAGRHENNAVILAKWKAFRDGTSDIYPKEVQYYFEHTLTLSNGPRTHLLAYVKWYKNAPSSSIRFKHKFMGPEVSNIELWKEEYYEEGQDSIIAVHRIYGRAIKIDYRVGNKNNKKNYVSIIPLNRRFNV